MVDTRPVDQALGGASRARREGHVAVQALVEQGTNTLVSISGSLLASRHLTSDDFGRFALFAILVIVVLGMVRSSAVDPLLISEEDGDDESRAFGFVAVWCLVGVALAGVATATTQDPAYLLAGITLAATAMFEVCRGIAIRRRRYIANIILELLWLAAVVFFAFGIIPMASQGPLSVVPYWLGASIPALATLVLLTKTRPRFSVRPPHPSMAARTSAEYATIAVGAYIGSALLGLTGALAALGGVRLLQTVFGPTNVLFTATSNFVLPKWRGEVDPGQRAWMRRSLAVSAITTGAIGVVGAAATVVSLAGGFNTFFGEGWDEAADLLYVYSAGMVFQGLATGPMVVMRARRQLSASLRVRRRGLLLLAGLPSLGALLDGGNGYVWGLLAANIAVYALWYLEQRAQATPEPEAA